MTSAVSKKSRNGLVLRHAEAFADRAADFWRYASGAPTSLAELRDPPASRPGPIRMASRAELTCSALTAAPGLRRLPCDVSAP